MFLHVMTLKSARKFIVLDIMVCMLISYLLNFGLPLVGYKLLVPPLLLGFLMWVVYMIIGFFIASAVINKRDHAKS